MPEPAGLLQAPAVLMPDAAMGAPEGEDNELLVSRESPHTIVAASPAWLSVTDLTEEEVVGQAATLLQGEGTCATTCDTLWTSLQVRTGAGSVPGPRRCRRERRPCCTALCFITSPYMLPSAASPPCPDCQPATSHSAASRRDS